MNPAQVIDDLLAADEKRQIRLALAQAKRDLEDSNLKTCGRCDLWMKSSLCPQEQNVNGCSRGPSSDSPLARTCTKFQRSLRAVENTNDLTARVEKIAAAKCFSDLPPNTHY